MNKLRTALLAFCFPAAAGLLYTGAAQAMDDSMGKSAMDQGSMDQGGMKKDAMATGMTGNGAKHKKKHARKKSDAMPDGKTGTGGGMGMDPAK